MIEILDVGADMRAGVLLRSAISSMLSTTNCRRCFFEASRQALAERVFQLDLLVVFHGRSLTNVKHLIARRLRPVGWLQRISSA